MPTQEANNENERKLKEGMDTGGGPSSTLKSCTRGTTELPTRAREKANKNCADVGISNASDGGSESGPAEQRKASADPGGETKVRDPVYLKQGMRLKKVHRVMEVDQEPGMEPYIRMNRKFR